jgi:hypothetical protein
MSDDSCDVLLQCPTLVEGIGPATKSKLNTAGVETIADLLGWQPEELGRRLSVSVPAAAKWLAAARLLLVEGVDKDCAEAFVEAGITSVQKLSEAGLQTLERAVKKAEEAGRMAAAPSLYRLAAMQRQAWQVRTSGMLVGRLTDTAGTAQAGVAVTVARRSTRTDEAGRFCLRLLPAGAQVLTLRFGHRLSTVPVAIKAGRLTSSIILQVDPHPADAAPKSRNEADGDLVWLQRQCFPSLVSCGLDDLPDSTHLQVREIGDDSVRLLHLYRQRIGDEVISQRVTVPREQLPQGATVGTVLSLSGSTLSTTELSLRDVAAIKLEAVAGKQNLRVMRRFVPGLPGEGL